ncbi:MAG TPA: ABC transporter ATP-binding protein [Vineibacter sp.]|nr:ABC transporter ATP-binding protein [Vineibacter sp.]
MLDVRNLHAGYGDAPVVRGASFTLQQHEMVALVGANGAGKTTLLRAISGVLPLSGAIRFDGVDIAGRRSDEIVALGLCQVPEGRRLFNGLTVEENLRLGRYRRRDKSRRATAAALERVFAYFPRLRERRRQLAGTMSGGEQQMCAIGRALMAAPRLLMIDELSLGLAPRIVEELVGILHQIRSDGTAILLVEQDVGVALAISDRALVLQTGVVVLEGDAQDLAQDDAVISSYLGGGSDEGS